MSYTEWYVVDIQFMKLVKNRFPETLKINPQFRFKEPKAMVSPVVGCSVVKVVVSPIDVMLDYA